LNFHPVRDFTPIALVGTVPNVLVVHPSVPAKNVSELVAYLKANPSSMAVVSGFHDPTGDAAKNAELAKNRAEAVRNALEGAGVDASRIDLHKPDETTGGGSHEDARRVEVTVQ